MQKGIRNLNRIKGGNGERTTTTTEWQVGKVVLRGAQIKARESESERIERLVEERAKTWLAQQAEWEAEQERMTQARIATPIVMVAKRGQKSARMHNYVYVRKEPKNT